MAIHDWRRVDAGIFHHFHHSWIEEIHRVLNGGLLPPDYYALAEQIAGGLGPDVLRAEPDLYATKAKSVVIRHRSKHRVIAIMEIVSPGNKNDRHGIRSFVEKAVTALRGGIHLLIVDLFPPGPRDPQGIHKAIWDDLIDNDFALPEDKPLTVVAYSADKFPESFVEPFAVGEILPEMPLFLTPDVYVPISLDATYLSAWKFFPSHWREVLTSASPPSSM